MRPTHDSPEPQLIGEMLRTLYRVAPENSRMNVIKTMTDYIRDHARADGLLAPAPPNVPP
jgi:hypothetical protein